MLLKRWLLRGGCSHSALIRPQLGMFSCTLKVKGVSYA